jgi:hypothetical protein
MTGDLVGSGQSRLPEDQLRRNEHLLDEKRVIFHAH